MEQGGFKLGVFAFLILLVTAAIFARADPINPLVLDELSDSRRGMPSAKSVQAQAGNISELNISAIVVTKTWQGYFGNVTGRIVLDNANNLSMYDWDIASPEGEIYASNDSISSWSSIKCFNYSAHSPELNLSHVEAHLDCAGDADGVNETFSVQNHPEFYVGTKKIDADSCWSTQTYVNDGSASNFYEVLLLEPTSNALVYTSLLNSSQLGFDNTATDFQLLVGENGHGTAASSTTPYYFYVEIY